MEAYTDFSKVYDIFMDETPYEEWAEFIHKLVVKMGINKGLLLDLGCGTGTMSEIFAKMEYDVIGIDISTDMLRVATDKKEQSGLDILYLCQDMRKFELYGTVSTIISVCDSLNYLLSEQDVEKTFRLVNNYLDPKGVFIFDFNTDYKYKHIIGDTVIAENRDTCSFIWENTYYEEEKLNEYELTIFVKDGNLYQKFIEEHYQKGYSLEEMKTLVEKAGMEFVEAIDADTKSKPTTRSERIYIVAREQGK